MYLLAMTYFRLSGMRMWGYSSLTAFEKIAMWRFSIAELKTLIELFISKKYLMLCTFEQFWHYFFIFFYKCHKLFLNSTNCSELHFKNHFEEF